MFIDKNMNTDKVYYRVLFKSESGKETYSNVEMLDFIGNFEYTIHPNPNNGNFTLRFNSEEDQQVNYTLYDMLGKTVVDNSIVVNGLVEKNINLSNVNAGFTC